MNRSLALIAVLLIFVGCTTFPERGVTLSYTLNARCKALVFAGDTGLPDLTPNPLTMPRADWIYMVYTIDRIDNKQPSAREFRLLPDHFFIPKPNGDPSSTNRATRDGWSHPVPVEPDLIVIPAGSAVPPDTPPPPPSPLGYVILRYAVTDRTAEDLFTSPGLGRNSLGYEANAPDQPVAAFASAGPSPLVVERFCEFRHLPAPPVRRLY